MTTTPVSPGNGNSPDNNATVANGNTLDVLNGGTANNTTVQSGGTLQVEAGGTETAAIIQAGGLETDYGSSSNDLDYGTINLAAAGTATTSTATISGATVESGGTLNLNLKGALATNTTVLSGGALTINGNAAANGTTLQGGTLELISAKADSTNGTGTSASGTLTFASGYSSRLQLDVAQGGNNGTTFAQTITGFAAGDVIDLVSINNGVVTTAANGSNTNVTVTGTNSAGMSVSETFTFVGAAPAGLTTKADPGTAATMMPAGGTDLIVPCYVTGTLIRTTDGDVAVENLAVGDLVVTASGARRPIKWIGHRRTECRRHPQPHAANPIRVAAHAFAPNRPARDLFVSPGHSICVDLVGEVLIPAFALVNGATVQQVEVEAVTYWHVELDSHDVILAENLACESYLDMGNRPFFAENGIVTLDAKPDASLPTHADFCRPFHMDGRLVDAVRSQLSVRARELGWRLEAQGLDDLHLLVDGVRVAPQVRGFVARFAIPAAARDVWLVSPTSIPAAVVDSPDLRSLGACLTGLDLDDGFGTQTIALDDPRLCVGFHALEGDGATSWRWTAGRARLPASLWADAHRADGESELSLRVKLAGPMLPLWVAPAAAWNDTPMALAG